MTSKTLSRLAVAFCCLAACLCFGSACGDSGPTLWLPEDGPIDFPNDIPDTTYSTKYVDVMFKPTADMPWGDPNYFDIQHTDEESAVVWAWMNGGFMQEQRIRDFLEAEGLTVKERWESGPGIMAALPAGLSAQDAITNWPVEYPEVIESVNLVPLD
jgi:hypothetical protein